MSVDNSINLEAFLSAHLDALEQDQPRHNLMLGILDRAKANPEQVRLWSFGDGTACAVQTPPHNVVLGVLNKQQSEILAKELVGKDFIGCLGSEQSAELVANSLLRLGIPLELEMPQRIYILDKAPIHPICEGSGRRATSRDIELFVDWFSRFCAEAAPNDPPQNRKRIEQQFAQGKIFSGR